MDFPAGIEAAAQRVSARRRNPRIARPGERKRTRGRPEEIQEELAKKR